MTDQLAIVGLEPPAPVVAVVEPWDPDRTAQRRTHYWTCPMCWWRCGLPTRPSDSKVDLGHRCCDVVPALIVGVASGGCRVCGEYIARDRDGNPPRRPDGASAWSHPECELQDEPFRYPVHMSKFAREMAGLATAHRDSTDSARGRRE